MPKRATVKEQESVPKRKEEAPPKLTLSSVISNKFSHKALQLIILCAIYSPISWLSLTPVYGSVPSALYHHQGKVVAVLAGHLGRKWLRKILPAKTAEWLPSFAFWIPTIQYVLFKYSPVLGVPYGPLVTQILTYYPLTTLSVFTAEEYLQRVVEVAGSGGSSVFLEHGAIVLIYLVFTVLERFVRATLLRNMGANIVFSRIGLQVCVALMYTAVIPGALWWPALPSVAFTMGYNVHTQLQRTTGLLNSNLEDSNFTMIDRQESVTGYISVLDNTLTRCRIMRCDHSLLGGEWKKPARQDGRGTEAKLPRVRTQEPIYAIFVMLEAVRLVESEPGKARRADSESTALNIGLGTGSAPGALIAHGIDTTIVELDPVVYDFALRYFDFPANHTPVIGDAIQFVEYAQRRKNASTKYDYIIHDVFTGGAEPVELFTEEFLSGLKSLLKEDGVFAINYAGDLSLPSTSHIIATILSVFTSNCRIFRESLPEPKPKPDPAGSSSSNQSSQEDFTNMIIYCTTRTSNHSSSASSSSSSTTTQPFTFRDPNPSDFLKSGARQHFLRPRPELEMPIADLLGGGTIITKNNMAMVEKWHKRSAVGHWHIMRRVLPDVVWENW